MMRADVSNPNKIGSDEHELWEICVRRDILAFAAADWSICAADFKQEGFSGWDAGRSADPHLWRMAFPSLGEYRRAWEKDAAAHISREWERPLRDSLFEALTLARVDITGDVALVHKRFDGRLLPRQGQPIQLRWQSLFQLRRECGRWLQTGFVGYMPL